MKHRRKAELDLLAAMPKGRWVSALELAQQMGWPWRVVARGLKRLGASREVRTNVAEWRGARSRIRQTTVYRADADVVKSRAELPAWLAPPQPAPVVGARAVRFDDDQEGDGPE